MKKNFLRSLALVLCLVLLAAALPVSAEEQAPDFAVLDWDGNTVRFSALKGKPVIINIWASWCGPCCSELGEFNEAYLACGDRITFMMIDLADGDWETVDGAKAFVTENGYVFPVYFDVNDEAAYAYGITAIPLTVLIDADGNIVEQHLGSMSGDTLMQYVGMLLD